MHDSEMLGVSRDVIEELVEELLAEATPLGSERRSRPRATFLVPVSVVRIQDGRQREIACLSRDISADGVGLLHSAPLEKGPVVVKIPRKSGGPTQLPCEILWCHACGEGWYLAGAAFVPAEQAT